MPSLCLQDGRELEHFFGCLRRVHPVAVGALADSGPPIDQLQLFFALLSRGAHPVRPQRNANSPWKPGGKALPLDDINHAGGRPSNIARHVRHRVRGKQADKLTEELAISRNGGTATAEGLLACVAGLAEMGWESAALEGDALDVLRAEFLVQALDIGAECGLGCCVVAHEWEGRPCRARGCKGNGAVALGAEERDDGLGDVHLSEEVDLEHVVDEGITVSELAVCHFNLETGVEF